MINIIIIIIIIYYILYIIIWLFFIMFLSGSSAPVFISRFSSLGCVQTFTFSGAWKEIEHSALKL